MADVTDYSADLLVQRARQAGNIVQGFLVGVLGVAAVIELYAGVGIKTFLYQGF